MVGTGLSSSPIGGSGLGEGLDSFTVPLGGTAGAGLYPSPIGFGLGSGVGAGFTTCTGEAGSGHEAFSPAPPPPFLLRSGSLLGATPRCLDAPHPICSLSPSVKASTEPTRITAIAVDGVGTP